MNTLKYVFKTPKISVIFVDYLAFVDYANQVIDLCILESLYITQLKPKVNTQLKVVDDYNLRLRILLGTYFSTSSLHNIVYLRYFLRCFHILLEHAF